MSTNTESTNTESTDVDDDTVRGTGPGLDPRMER